ncbi:MAG: hypothetical protein ABFR33_03795 [Verrucomicrobiota bacterium]
MPIHQVGAWQAGPTDASKIVADSYIFIATTRPIVPSANLQVLHLDTQSDGVTNSFDIPDADQVLYMDAMLNLSPRTGIPESVTNDPSVQLFFYMNTDTNLVVYNGGTNGASPAMTVISGTPLLPGEWNRYTVTMDFANGDGAGDRKYFKLQLNGTNVTSAQAYSAPGATGAFDGGAWFFTADQTGPDSIDSVAFEGAGDLDDLVMTTRAPLFTTTQVYYVVSELLGPGTMTPVMEVPVVEGASTQIVYQADPWYEILDFEQDGAPVPGALGEQVYTAVFANVQADISNLVQFAESVAVVDGKTPATWYGPLGADPSESDEDGDGLTLYEEYLLNTDPVAGNIFVITDFGLVGQTPWLSWESLGLPNGSVVAEVSTNLTEGGWGSQSGYLSYDGTYAIWQSAGETPEQALFLRAKLSE